MRRFIHQVAIAATLFSFALPAAAQRGGRGADSAGGRGAGLPLTPTTPLKFTTDEGTWLSLDVSPDGRTIVFELLGDLYTIPIEGGKATRITSGQMFDAQPHFSPDGKSIVFVSDRSQEDNLWIVNADGSHPRALTRETNQRFQSPTFTPDGKYVVVSRGNDIYMYYAAGGGAGLRLTGDSTPAGRGGAPGGGRGGAAPNVFLGPAVSHDGRYVYFAMRNSAGGGYNQTSLGWQIGELDRETGRTFTKTNAVGSGMRPELSPDGRWLAYGTRNNADESLMLRDLSSGDERLLLAKIQRDDQESRPNRDLLPTYAFTPDSKSIIIAHHGHFWRANVADGKETMIPFTADVDMMIAGPTRETYTIDDSTLVVHQIRDVAPSPDNKRLAFTALDRLWIMDLPSGTPKRLVPSESVGEFQPAWSPDGRYVTFTGIAGGLSDLFIYDLKDNVLKQMTRDPYGDLQPVWSPDGKTIAFVTERFSTNLEWIDIGNYELALLDVESGRIQKLLAFPNGKNINPQWTADSSALYFLSDQSGKTDLYRIDVASAKITEVTNLYAGIAGITALSPAISVAHGTGRLVFSGYQDGYYTIYSLDDPAMLQGESYLAQFERDPSILPPRTEPEGALLGLLKNPLFGMPKDTNFAVVPYRAKLGLDYVSPPNVAVGVDRYGTYGAGGIAAYWSDMLGYHTIVTTAFTGSRLIDTSGVLAYLNNRGRFNWGGAAQRLVYPYPYYLFFYSDPATGGDGFYHEIEDVFRLINYDVSLFGSYPLSQVGRFQLSTGLRIQDFSETLYERIYSLDGLLLDYRKTHPAGLPPALTYGYATAGYYYDTGMFGATSPILGQNLGLSVQQALGSVTFTTAVADFRKYIMPVKPFTLAFRALHMGRYGKSSEDTRFYPLYIAYWDLVRGYESISTEELETYRAESSKAFDFNRLYGSRMIVANAELRFPLLGLLGLGKGFYGAWPLEAYAFFDAGLAYASHPSQWWGGYLTDDAGNVVIDPETLLPIPDTKKIKPWFAGGDRKPVTSVGFGLRTNLFGYFVLGLNYVYPIERPQRGWHFQVSISPGF